MQSLHQCLLDTDPVRLRAIARFWNVELTSSRQRDIAAQLAEAMAAPAATRHAWQTLPDDQRQALEALLVTGGHMPLRVFARQFGEIRAMGPGKMARERPWQHPISPAEGLWHKGFIFRTFEQEAEETYEVALVPPELQRALPTPAPPPSATRLEPARAPAVVWACGDASLDDACSLLAYLQNERVRASPDGAWPAGHEARLTRRLCSPSLDRLSLLHHVVRQLAWLRVTDSGRTRPEPVPATVWLEATANQQRRVLTQAWREAKTWNDLFHVPSFRCEDTGSWRNDPLLARRVIIHHLTACIPDTWYCIDEFIANIKRADPDFQRPGGNYAAWYIRDTATGAYLSGFESWDAVEGALIRYILTGPLAWLGLTDLGTAAPDRPPILFRLTRAGAALVGVAEPPPEPDPLPLTLQADFTVRVPSARRYERFQLARAADWVRTGDCCGNPFVYRITPTSLERARRQGIPVARVLGFLASACEAPVPRFVEAALTRWDAQGAEAFLERAVLLRLTSDELMAQVTSSPITRHLIQERVGPTTALVRERDWPRLATALGKLALLAQIVNLEDNDAD